MRKPKATVLMPVFNSLPHLREAVESILNQSFRDFEFLIFDDGSTDGSREILQSYDDPRIQLFSYAVNTGYVRHLNTGIDLARGEYIFRMDADDIALPERFERQIAFLDANPEVGLCGTWVSTIGAKETIVRRPCQHEEIQLQLLSGTTFVHPTVALRTAVLRQHGLRYEEAFLYAEDYVLWVHLAQVTRLAILPEVLLHYRVHEQSVSTLHFTRQMEIVNHLRRAQFETLLNRPLNPFERRWATFEIDLNQLQPIHKIFALHQSIQSANRHTASYDPDLLHRYLLDRLAYTCKHQQVHARAVHLLNLLVMHCFFPDIYHRLYYWKKVRRLPRRILRRLSMLLGGGYPAPALDPLPPQHASLTSDPLPPPVHSILQAGSGKPTSTKAT